MTVLLINFPIVLGKGVEVYKKFIETTDDRGLFNLPQFQLSNLDSKTYMELTRYLLYIIRMNPNISINVLCDEKNISQYFPKDNFDLISFDRSSHNNDFNFKNIDSYKWITIPEQINISNSPFKYDDIFKFTKDDFLKLNIPDKIILCFSMEIIPPCDRLLFDLWINLINDITNQKLDFMDTNEYHIY